MDQAIRVLGITGCLTATYLFAGGFLVVRGLQSRPVQGDAIRFLNLVIVAPILVVLMAPLLSPLLVPLFGLAFHNQFEFMPFAVAAFSAANSLLVWVVILRQRRAVWESVRRWLDPTIDCHQP
ncbi:MAG TPA: hypothetical protein VHR66_02730 [Gemmataceae bacterium]|nr:hypothetical protein [Gemmataceae bacterium]